MSELPLRAGVVGCGQVARHFHIPSYESCARTSLVALYNHRLHTVADLKWRYPQVEIWDDYEGFLRDAGVQLISLCTPNAMHADMAIAALRHGIHVLVEKPMAVSLPEARAMMEAARLNAAVLMIGHSQRYIPRYRRAHEVVRSGALGRILQVQASLGHSGPLDWSPRGTWFITPELAGRGVIGDQAVHIADTLRYLTGQEAKTIAAFDASFRHKEVEDNAVAVLRLSAGTLATISTSWTMRGTALDQFVLVGEEGTLRVGSESGCPLVLVTASGERHEYSVPDGIPEVGGALQLDEVPEFVETILGERANPIPPEDGYRALEICIAMERSAQSGQFVQLPLGD